MPLVHLYYHPHRDGWELAQNLAAALPKIIAPHLTIPTRDRHDGQVTPEDIIVRPSAGSSIDANTLDIEIVILAHDFPERRANLEERKENIIKGIRAFLGEISHPLTTGSVWILLMPTAFGRI